MSQSSVLEQELAQQLQVMKQNASFIEESLMSQNLLYLEVMRQAFKDTEDHGEEESEEESEVTDQQILRG